MLYRYLIGCFFLLHPFSNTCFGQKELLNKEVVLPPDINFTTKKQVLQFISKEHNIIFSYNANLINDESTVNLKNRSGTVKEMVASLFSEPELILLPVLPNKIILRTRWLKINEISLSGKIYDKESGELIFGAVIFEKHSNQSVLSNERGYFTLELPPGNASLEIRYLGYSTKNVDIDLKINTKLDIPLNSDNFLDTIIIDDPTSRIQLTDGGNIVEVFKSKSYRSIIGEKDIINNTRIIPGVQAGGEGQGGLFVRGGTPDQNLIMMDGIALYETSHIAGISSIFMEENIKEASFVKNGFPARYGGRLSGVLDIHLKEGNRYNHKKLISAGIAGAKLHFEGPIIKEKMTYSISARTSWLNFYVNNLLRKFTKYDNINLAYTDLTGKFTHHFKPTSSLSLTLYHGSDRLQLTKDNTFTGENYLLEVFDRNGLNWGNTLATLKWNVLLNDKLSLKTQAGVLKYNNGSRSSYKFETIYEASTKTDELDVITNSNILDYNFRADVEYYLNDKHVLRAGSNFMWQQFNPTVKQSTVILDSISNNIVDKDSLIKARQYQFYIEDNFKINTSLFLYAGLHYGVFVTEKTTYASMQPRIKLIWTPVSNHMISGSYSKMSQFIHLLSNSGLGLPSDLWVPSTKFIQPQSAIQYSMNYTLNFKPGFYINAGGYTKSYTNSLEYTSPVELFYFLINNQNIVPVYNTSRDWERNLLVGTTKSRGLELLVHKTEGNTKGWASATWSKTTRKFDGLNNGLPFPANHDKTWNLNFGLSRKFNEALNIGINFVYTTGNTFSLATEAYDSALGITLLKSNGRNNYRLPPFHQLGLNANYTIKGKYFNTILDLNIYNLYNRLNAYFIYIYENPLPPYNRYLRKVSILPFTPSISVSLQF